MDSDTDLRLSSEGAPNDPITVATVQIEVSYTGTVAFAFTSSIYLEEGTQYNFLVESSNGLYANRAVFHNRFSAEPDYVGSTYGKDVDNDGYYDSASDSTTYDLTFRVNPCE